MTRRYFTAAAVRALESRLTTRDLAVLQCVSSLRFVSGAQLARLCFTDSADPLSNARAARRALLRLTRLDILTRLPRPVGGVRAGSAGYVYHLALAGQRLAGEHGWQPAHRGRQPLAPGSLFLRHTLLIAELHTRLVEADRSRRIELLELAAEPSCWRKLDGLGGQQVMLKPDSYIRLGIREYEDSYFVEVDRGTEGSRAIEHQLRAYAAYHLSGAEQDKRGVFPCVLWLTTSAERVGVIDHCVKRLPLQARELFRVIRFDQALTMMANMKNSEH
jgi:Replication-relaxation